MIASLVNWRTKTDEQFVAKSKKETLHDKVVRLAGLDVDEQFYVNTLSDLLQKCDKQLPEIELHRMRPFYITQTKAAEINGCVFTENITDIKLLTTSEKSSSSDTWVMFGKFFDHPVTIKLSLLQTRTNQTINDNSLEIERLLYRRVINPLIGCGYTPHVVVYYTELFCDNFGAAMNAQINHGDKAMTQLATTLRASHFLKPIREQQPPMLNIDKMRASVTERVTGFSLENLIKQQPVNASNVAQLYTFEHICLPILFQVVYTLAIFKQVGLVHNDLHPGNVLVQEYLKPVKYCYAIDGRVYQVESKLQSRIFDFDRGAKVPTEFDPSELRNTLLSRSKYCKSYGQCPQFDERRELFLLCSRLYIFNNHKNAELDKLLTRIVPIDLLTRKTALDEKPESIIPGKTLVSSGRLCACEDRDCETCILINDHRIKTTSEIIAMPEFTRYLIDRAEVGNTFLWTVPSKT